MMISQRQWRTQDGCWSFFYSSSNFVRNFCRLCPRMSSIEKNYFQPRVAIITRSSIEETVILGFHLKTSMPLVVTINTYPDEQRCVLTCNRSNNSHTFVALTHCFSLSSAAFACCHHRSKPRRFTKSPAFQLWHQLHERGAPRSADNEGESKRGQEEKDHEGGYRHAHRLPT